jgi:hypothetical protein
MIEMRLDDRKIRGVFLLHLSGKRTGEGGG